jgi:hypothetical protein
VLWALWGNTKSGSGSMGGTGLRSPFTFSSLHRVAARLDLARGGRLRPSWAQQLRSCRLSCGRLRLVFNRFAIHSTSSITTRACPATGRCGWLRTLIHPGPISRVHVMGSILHHWVRERAAVCSKILLLKRLCTIWLTPDTPRLSRAIDK